MAVVLLLRRRIENLTKEIEAALSAAREAGEVLRGAFGKEQVVRYKAEVDIVTEVDEQAERVIREILLGTFPSYGMLAEEGGKLRGQEDARWIVDPLDGTINYAHGLSIFCVSVALERAGEVALGVVYDPMREETYVAQRGGGATLNGEPIRVSGTTEMLGALMVSGFPYDRDQVPSALELFSRFAMLTQSVRRLGSAALDLSYNSQTVGRGIRGTTRPQGGSVQEAGWDAEAELERRLDLVSKPEYEGEDMRGVDYVWLFVVTLVLPILMMIGGWVL